jgi:small subunit ribosomal protein S3
MGKKINPKSFRLGAGEEWSSKWFKSKGYALFLREDLAIRDFIFKKLKQGAIKDVLIERSENSLKIKILAGRPGVVIGRGGVGIEETKNGIKATMMSVRSTQKKNKGAGRVMVDLEVKEIKNFEENADLVAQNVAEQLEKRVSFRRVLKSTLDSVSKQREVKGVKIMIAGRLNGAEMCRREWVISGGIPLHTIRANIDYSKKNAYTTYGVIGVKVWIYKGEIFDTEEKESINS